MHLFAKFSCPKFSHNHSCQFSHQLSLEVSHQNNSATNILVCHQLAEPCSESHSCQPCAGLVIGQHYKRLVSAAALMKMLAPFCTNCLPRNSRPLFILSVRHPKKSPYSRFAGNLGQQVVSTVSPLTLRRVKSSSNFG